MALPTCECLPGLYPNWKALGPIVAAARTWAGESEDLACYEGRPIGEQLKALYCALYSVAQNGPNPPVDGIEMDVLFRLTSGTAGTLMDVAAFNAGTLGVVTGWGYTEGKTELHHTAVSDISTITLPTPFSCAGQTVTEVSKSPDFDLTEALANPDSPLYEGVILNQAGNFSAEVTDFVVVLIVEPAVLIGSNNVGFDILSMEGGGYGVIQLVAALSGGLFIRIHTSVATGSLLIPVQPNGRYEVCGMFSNTEGKCYYEVMDIDAGQSIGAIVDDFVSTGLEFIKYQDYALTADGGGGNLIPPLVGLRENTTVFPCWEDYVVPTPTSLVVTQLAADELTLTFSILGTQFEVLRSDNGGAYVSLGTFEAFDYADSTLVGATTFTDATVVDAHTYLYRVFAKMRSFTSAVGQFASITVDNGPFSGGSPIVTAYPGGFAASNQGDVGFKFTWSATNKNCTELGITPTGGTFADVPVTVRLDSDGTIVATVTITTPFVNGVEKFAAITPFVLTNGVTYRLTADPGPFNEMYFAVGVGGFTFSPNISAPAPVAADGTDPTVAAFVNLKFA
jgi:hypothetical protein